MIRIEEHLGVKVVRDDLLPGGTKSILLPSLLKKGREYVYASPVYGGFQIALAIYGKAHGIAITIFCAQRKETHPNTVICRENGAKVVEVKVGYLVVVEKHARDYCDKTGAVKIKFGALDERCIAKIASRVRQAIKKNGGEPHEIFCAVGSGTLVRAILSATTTAKVYGVVVGKECDLVHPRLTLIPYHKPFDKISTFNSGFQSMPNYDLKAFEYCIKYKKSKSVMFWNVL